MEDAVDSNFRNLKVLKALKYFWLNVVGFWFLFFSCDFFERASFHGFYRFQCFSWGFFNSNKTHGNSGDFHGFSISMGFYFHDFHEFSITVLSLLF